MRLRLSNSHGVSVLNVQGVFAKRWIGIVAPQKWEMWKHKTCLANVIETGME